MMLMTRRDGIDTALIVFVVVCSVALALVVSAVKIGLVSFD